MWRGNTRVRFDPTSSPIAFIFVPCGFMRMHSRQFATKPCLDGLQKRTGDFGGRAFRPHEHEAFEATSSNNTLFETKFH